MHRAHTTRMTRLEARTGVACALSRNAPIRPTRACSSSTTCSSVSSKSSQAFPMPTCGPSQVAKQLSTWVARRCRTHLAAPMLQMVTLVLHTVGYPMLCRGLRTSGTCFIAWASMTGTLLLCLAGTLLAAVTLCALVSTAPGPGAHSNLTTSTSATCSRKSGCRASGTATNNTRTRRQAHLLCCLRTFACSATQSSANTWSFTRTISRPFLPISPPPSPDSCHSAARTHARPLQCQ
mmetsp:Transcript_14169/g.36720  ORF Transcript_14169/g.36720 Transcript_14169/m.36720 type:complete len:236 (-) Transcript_14169:842-1549(-)